MKQLIRHILKEQSEGLSKLELFVFNKLRFKKENPYIDPFGTYKFIESLGFNYEETKNLFTLYVNNFKEKSNYESLVNVDRSDKINDYYFSILFDNLFDPEEVNWTHPYGDSDDNYDHEDSNRIEFYLGDYEFGDNTIFRWYDKDYWDEDNKHNKSFSPMIELEDLELQNDLMGIFGESWMKPFMEWIKDNFNVEVKHVAI